MPDTDKYPHVDECTKRIVKKYETLLTNTGGNDPLDLLNDLYKPEPNNLMAVNIVRFTLAVGIQSQVGLLHLLEKNGRLK